MSVRVIEGVADEGSAAAELERVQLELSKGRSELAHLHQEIETQRGLAVSEHGKLEAALAEQERLRHDHSQQQLRRKEARRQRRRNAAGRFLDSWAVWLAFAAGAAGWMLLRQLVERTRL